MSEETPKKKGLIAMIREYLSEAGRCPCDLVPWGHPGKPDEKETEEDRKDSDRTAKQ